MPPPAICWFRNDLRLADNPALTAAAQHGPIIALYIRDVEAVRPPGGASDWWLHHSLAALAKALAAHDVPLVLAHDPAEAALTSLCRASGADAVYWNRLYEPDAIARDKRIKANLQETGIATESFNGALLFEPWEIETKAGGPYTVFTPFWKALQAKGAPSAPSTVPAGLRGWRGNLDGETLDDWALLPAKPDWASGLRESWSPGEAGARAAFNAFIDGGLSNYAIGRDFPSEPGCSRLSPHLHFGEISPRQIWHSLTDGSLPEKQSMAYLRELGWRDFNHHLLFHFPTLPADEFKQDFKAFPWNDDEAGYRAWCRGQTGYPIVDAGMRQLWHMGWMHNRVRMIAASFLIKHLLTDWRRGEAWFWDTLVDADLANNSANWQWVAGCGADAAPYFRIFNPILQGEKFDRDGDYVRRWVPELARLESRFLHKPWEAPDDILSAAGIRLGDTYPEPIVDHAVARARALDCYKSLKG
jgi:deoxyribodipyrimidine photo-lyase